MKRSTWILADIFFAAGGVVGAVHVRQAREKDRVRFATAKIDRGRIVARVTATGTLSALVTVQVGSQVSGAIAALYADFNSEVKERTREIGVRMAVGANPRNILAQFLVEALTLAVAGGLSGIALGLAAAGRLAAQFHWPTLIRADVIAIAVVFSGLVGVVFGLYPPRQASRLDPIDALRFE